MSPDSPASTLAEHRSGGPAEWVQIAAGVVAATFLLVGVLGFVPGITTGYDDLQLASHDSEAHLLGIFQVSVLHNVVHLLFGVVGLVMARSARAARSYLIGGGAVYLVLWLYGLLIDKDSAANFIPVNVADDWLHLGLGVLMIGLALLLGRRRRTMTIDAAGRAHP